MALMASITAPRNSSTTPVKIDKTPITSTPIGLFLVLRGVASKPEIGEPVVAEPVVSLAFFKDDPQ